MLPRPVPELLSPAGSLDAVRAAIANGADAVYLGASRFNARDDGAQLSLDELETACRLAHERGRRIYLTFNVLIKPTELVDALIYLGDCIDRGIDAAIVQDIGVVRLIHTIYPTLEVHGSTQMTVHDESGARVMHRLGVERVVLARENTLEDLRMIKRAVPEIGLETFVHGALCISYSGQCYMSGMISERSANRGSCAQSCRKDYVLNDDADSAELDRGYLISARDLAAHDHLAEIAEAGIGCLKVEGRKKKPEYVATVTKSYRDWLDRLARGEQSPPTPGEVQPLVQIFSRGNTGGMYGGRAGRDYITRDHPDNRGVELGTVIAREGEELIVDLSSSISTGDGLGFEPPAGLTAVRSMGFAVGQVRTVSERNGIVRQAIRTRDRVPVGWRVVRSSEAALLQRARDSFALLPAEVKSRKVACEMRVFGASGTPLKLVATAGGETVTVRSEIALAPAQRRALDREQLRDQLGRLGETPFVLGALDDAGLSPGLFLPVSELNHLRQAAVEELLVRRDWALAAAQADLRTRVTQAIDEVRIVRPARLNDSGNSAHGQDNAGNAHAVALRAEVFNVDDARAAADAGATEIVFDPFLRHPAPPPTRLLKLAVELRERGIPLRLRTPTIIRPEERADLDRWLALDLPILSGHLGLVADLGGAGRDVLADYAVNCFNQHTAAEIFSLGARRITLSIELTADEMADVARPWNGAGFDVIVHGRPEGMTLEHCVLSAAFNREPTTCRDLCVKKHPVVSLTDPSGYTFPVATDSACRNRLLHSRPIDASEYLDKLWNSGIRDYRLLFNVPGAPVAEVVARWREALNAMQRSELPDLPAIRRAVGPFTRGHFARAV